MRVIQLIAFGLMISLMAVLLKMKFQPVCLACVTGGMVSQKEGLIDLKGKHTVKKD